MNDLLDYRERYPNAPGYKARDTARKAAEEVKSGSRILRDQCLAAIRAAGTAGLTADETAEKVGKPILSVRPRLSELAKLAQIEDTGTRRRNDSGKSAIAWRAA